MKKEYRIVFLIYVIVLIFFACIAPVKGYLHCIYTTNSLQAPLFSGLLTVGTFLLSMKTFIIFKLKDDLYDNPLYIKKIQDALLVDFTEYDHYKGIKQLSDFLSLSILSSLLGAIVNITIGYFGNPIASAVCLAFSTCAIGLLLYAWWLVWRNLNDWLSILKNPCS